jgi:hypothetical protein
VGGICLARLRSRREADPPQGLRQDQGVPSHCAPWAPATSGQLSASSPPATPPGPCRSPGTRWSEPSVTLSPTP